MNRLFVAAALVASLRGAAGAAQVSLTRLPGGGHRIEAEFQVAASSGLVTEVLGDYGRIDEFVSSVVESVVLQRNADGALVAQRAEGKLFFFTKAVDVVLRVRERPGRLDFEDVSGKDFERYAGSWDVSPAPDGSLVSYRLEAKLKSGGEGRFARFALRRGASKLIDQLRAEILRRAAAR